MDVICRLCVRDLRKGYLIVLSWARVRRIRQGGVNIIRLFPPVARCQETIDVCIWHMFVFMSIVVTVWGSVGMM